VTDWADTLSCYKTYCTTHPTHSHGSTKTPKPLNHTPQTPPTPTPPTGSSADIRGIYQPPVSSHTHRKPTASAGTHHPAANRMCQALHPDKSGRCPIPAPWHNRLLHLRIDPPAHITPANPHALGTILWSEAVSRCEASSCRQCIKNRQVWQRPEDEGLHETQARKRCREALPR
jgi:hypothetical protein